MNASAVAISENAIASTKLLREGNEHAPDAAQTHISSTTALPVNTCNSTALLSKKHALKAREVFALSIVSSALMPKAAKKPPVALCRESKETLLSITFAVALSNSRIDIKKEVLDTSKSFSANANSNTGSKPKKGLTCELKTTSMNRRSREIKDGR